MPKMEAIISVRYRVPVGTDVPDSEFKDARVYDPDTADDKKAVVLSNEKAVEKSRRQAAKDAEELARKYTEKKDVLSAFVEEVREA